jgi:hypothetical protein
MIQHKEIYQYNLQYEAIKGDLYIIMSIKTGKLFKTSAAILHTFKVKH